MNPGYDRPDHHDFRRRITHECMFCHNAYPEIEPGSDGFGRDSIYAGNIPQGIDCQRCHGPGRDHIDLVQNRNATADTVRASIVNPSRFEPDCFFELGLRLLIHLRQPSRRWRRSAAGETCSSTARRPARVIQFRLHYRF